MNILMIVVIKLAVRNMVQFRWSANVIKLLIASGLTVILSFAIVRLLPDSLVLPAGIVFNLACGVLCLRGLVSRLGPSHRLSQICGRFPFLGTGKR